MVQPMKEFSRTSEGKTYSIWESCFLRARPVASTSSPMSSSEIRTRKTYAVCCMSRAQGANRSAPLSASCAESQLQAKISSASAFRIGIQDV